MHPAQLHQPLTALDVLAPGVGFTNEKVQIAIRLHPDIESDVPIAQRHRFPRTGSRHIPAYVQIIELLTHIRPGKNQSGSEGNQYNQRSTSKRAAEVHKSSRTTSPPRVNTTL